MDYWPCVEKPKVIGQLVAVFVFTSHWTLLKFSYHTLHLYWSFLKKHGVDNRGTAFATTKGSSTISQNFMNWNLPSPLLDNIRVTSMVIVRRLRVNIIRTALCWIVWHNVHSQQHSYMSSSYRSNRLGLSHWDPYAVRRGGCLELLYY